METSTSASFSSLQTLMSLSTHLRPTSTMSSFRYRLLPLPIMHPLLPSFPKPISFQPLSFKPPSPPPPQSHPTPPSSTSQLPPKLQEIITLFQTAPQDPRTKYQQLLFYANQLPPLSPHLKIPSNKVQGCVSQVWVHAYPDPQNNNIIHYDADSDSLMTKGLAALLVLGLSGRLISEIVGVSPDFVTLLGLQHSLTPSRNNGFLNMLKLMQQKALLLGLQAEMQGLDEHENDTITETNVNNVDLMSQEVVEGGDVRVESEGRNYGAGLGLGRRAKRIREVLERELKPVDLEIEDVSYQHAGHNVEAREGGETHFNLKIVSSEFEGKSLVKRHRMVYGLLQDELDSGLHALSIDAKTPSEVGE